MMFNFLKGTKFTNLVAPISGSVVSIEEIPDEVFSQKMIGDGVAIDPTSEFVVAPCDGVVEKIFETNHAFCIKSTTGVEIFVHYGVDTVELKGKGFFRLIEKGAKVKAGDKILKTDLIFLKENARSVLTALVVSNMDELKSFDIIKTKSVVAGETVLIEAVIK